MKNLWEGIYKKADNTFDANVAIAELSGSKARQIIDDLQDTITKSRRGRNQTFHLMIMAMKMILLILTGGLFNITMAVISLAITSFSGNALVGSLGVSLISPIGLKVKIVDSILILLEFFPIIREIRPIVEIARLIITTLSITTLKK